MGTSFYGVLAGNLGESSYVGGLCVEEGSGTGVSPFRGPIRGTGEGDPSTGNLEE
jgi:hypothetical protein